LTTPQKYEVLAVMVALLDLCAILACLVLKFCPRLARIELDWGGISQRRELWIAISLSYAAYFAPLALRGIWIYRGSPFLHAMAAECLGVVLVDLHRGRESVRSWIVISYALLGGIVFAVSGVWSPK
jgi:hypothetical protein